MLKAELMPRFSVDGGAQAGGFSHHEKELSCPGKGNGPLKMSEASRRLSFFLFFFFCSGPLSLSGRARLCSPASQPFKVNLQSWRCGSRQGLRQGGGGGVQIKAGFEMSLIFGMLLRV